jgi:hypothetical protein
MMYISAKFTVISEEHTNPVFRVEALAKQRSNKSRPSRTLKGSGDDVSRLLGVWTSSIVRYSKKARKKRFGDCICFHPQVRGWRHLLHQTMFAVCFLLVTCLAYASNLNSTFLRNVGRLPDYTA